MPKAGSFIVEYWKGETVGYTTLTASGERAEQTVNILGKKRLRGMQAAETFLLLCEARWSRP